MSNEQLPPFQSVAESSGISCGINATQQRQQQSTVSVKRKDRPGAGGRDDEDTSTCVGASITHHQSRFKRHQTEPALNHAVPLPPSPAATAQRAEDITTAIDAASKPPPPAQNDRVAFLESKNAAIEFVRACVAHIVPFDRLCPALRRNDPAHTDLTDANGKCYIFPDFPDDHAQELGEALRGNTHVSKLYLDVPRCVGTENVNKTITSTAIQPMLDYLRTGPALQAVDLDEQCRYESLYRPIHWSEICLKGTPLWTELFLEAILQNPNMQELRLMVQKIPALPLRMGLQTTGLTKLDLSIFTEVRSSPTDRQLIQEAFAFNSSLTALSVRCSAAVVASILLGLAANPSRNCTIERLCVLQWRYELESSEFWPAFSQYRCHSICQGRVNELHLQDFDIRSQDMSELVRGLTGRAALDDDAGHTGILSSANSIVEVPISQVTEVKALYLTACCLDSDDCKSIWHKFLRSTVTVADALPLRELHLHGEYWDDKWRSSDLVAALCRPSRNCVESDARTSDTSRRALASTSTCSNDAKASEAVLWPGTIGSCIQTLSVSYYDPCFEQLLQAMSENAEHIQIKALDLPNAERLDADEIAALVQCIAQISSLRELTLHSDRRGSGPPVPRAILEALQQNANIQQVKLFKAESSLVDAFCERNRLLDPLLLQASIVRETFAAKQDTALCLAQENDETSSAKKELCLSLLQAAHPLLRKRSALVIRTMLRLDESIAPPDNAR